MPKITMIGAGRAAGSLVAALNGLAGEFVVTRRLARGDDLRDAAADSDLVILGVPDDTVEVVAAAIDPVDGVVLMHLSGSLTLDALAPHEARASMHPLAALPDTTTGAARLTSGIGYAVAGEKIAWELAEAMGGHPFEVAEEKRVAYHAAATVAANHTVALLGQVEHLAEDAGVPFESVAKLAEGAVRDAVAIGPKGALTGPAARGDEATLRAHEGVQRPEDLTAYRAISGMAARLGGGTRHGSPEIFETASAFGEALERARVLGRRVGLVPTMGALHEGHTSLMAQAAGECDVVAVTIFVNPLQFGDAGDLAAYPKTLESDRAICEAAGVEMIFAPSVREMYPGWPEPVATRVAVDKVSAPWEGLSRPGHFEGVATVVAKLFAIAGRCRAYFGEKDFQQLAVIRRMVTDLSIPVELVGCPTVREPDGLAMSSRNVRLDLEHRTSALVLARAMRAGLQLIDDGEDRLGAVNDTMAAIVGEEPRAILDYIAVVREADLAVATTPDRTGPLRILAAATVGGVRLIDNMAVKMASPGDGNRDGQESTHKREVN